MAKSKFKEVYCASCKKVTKMVILKEPEDNKGWFQCSKCRHSMCIDLSDIVDAKKENKEIPERENCIIYFPSREYKIGDGILHTEWDDTGRVESKEVTTDGISVLVVKFKNSGTKKLVEKLDVDTIEDDEKTVVVDEIEPIIS
jgi:aspartokinase-like uncharacterized kinase